MSFSKRQRVGEREVSEQVHAIDFRANREDEEFEIRAESLDGCYGTVEEGNIGRDLSRWISIEDICYIIGLASVDGSRNFIESYTKEVDVCDLLNTLHMGLEHLIQPILTIFCQ